eukprot:CAMPEP_0204365938 /NCGR_PEP_ID=MMETSP0469-20131031/42284_1 /ASSEMBLY_ACC=CAM_ASM_000384 /TAXON_ID=2969 /ORGANISM="Oxyrrhis marina" /LENGTH=125 /DNA_ID=CAMNT_0051355059 /DNA_START=634 /DNA_END=1007 /DNA_ORIENTATION=-
MTIKFATDIRGLECAGDSASASTSKPTVRRLELAVCAVALLGRLLEPCILGLISFPRRGEVGALEALVSAVSVQSKLAVSLLVAESAGRDGAGVGRSNCLPLPLALAIDCAHARATAAAPSAVMA